MNHEDDEGVEKQVHCARAGLLINFTLLYVNSC